MRRINRKDETCKTTSRNSITGDWIQRVWNETKIRERDWSKAHRGREMGAEAWNALWERVRDELYGEMWACESKREFAMKEAY